ncbi:hypothetical protein LTR17_003860 [Elasticomyces elasticus]|nr:hypothetical protein LTR17_003860 [Elasticomyces elasticus]
MAEIDTFLEAVADEDQTIMPALEVITTRTGHHAIFVGRCKNKQDEVVDAYVCPVGKTNVRAFETRIHKGKVLQEALAEYHIRMVDWADESLDYHKYFATHQAASKFGNGYEAHKKWMLAVWRNNIEGEYAVANRAALNCGDDGANDVEIQSMDDGKEKTTTLDERCMALHTKVPVAYEDLPRLQERPHVRQKMSPDAEKAKERIIKDKTLIPNMVMSPAKDWESQTSRVLTPLPEKLKPIEDHYCLVKKAGEANPDVELQMATEKRIKHELHRCDDSGEENDLLKLMRNAGDRSPNGKPYRRHPLEIAHLTESTHGSAKRRSGSEEWDYSKQLKTIRNPAFRGIVSEHMKGSPELSFAEEIDLMKEKKAKERPFEEAQQ